MQPGVGACTYPDGLQWDLTWRMSAEPALIYGTKDFSAPWCFQVLAFAGAAIPAFFLGSQTH